MMFRVKLTSNCLYMMNFSPLWTLRFSQASWKNSSSFSVESSIKHLSCSVCPGLSNWQPKQFFTTSLFISWWIISVIGLIICWHLSHTIFIQYESIVVFRFVSVHVCIFTHYNSFQFTIIVQLFSINGLQTALQTLRFIQYLSNFAHVNYSYFRTYI